MVALLATATLGAAPRQDVTDILTKAAAYLADYEKAFSVVLSEETYTQSTVSSFGSGGRRRRVLKSDVLQTSIGENAWVAFRDVFDVDGTPVRGRDERLQNLFVNRASEAVSKGNEILAESARYNIGSLHRNINVPTMALTYLRGANQGRSRFTVTGRQTIAGVRTVILSFSETSTPTVVRERFQNRPATGRFWIDPETGRVLRSELSIPISVSSSKITVTYAAVPSLPVWAPVEMKEEYTGWETIRGEATYARFRQFKVSVSETIK